MLLDLVVMFLIGFMGASFAILILRPKTQRRTRAVKQSPSILGTYMPKGPFGKNAKRKPRANDDEASWRKENNMDLRDE